MYNLNYFSLICPIYLLLILSSLACNLRHTSSMQHTIVEGQIDDYHLYRQTKHVELVRFEFEQVDHDFVSEIDSTGHFRFDIALNEAHEFLLIPFNDLHVFLKPGDSLFLSINLKGSNQVRFGGDAVEVNEELQNFYANGSLFRTESYAETYLSLSPEEFKNLSQGNLQTNLKRLSDDTNGNELSAVSRDLISKRMYNRYFEELITYGLSKCSMMNQSDNLEQRIQEYSDYFDPIFSEISSKVELIGGHGSFSGLLKQISVYRMMSKSLVSSEPRIRPIPYDQLIENILEEEMNPVIREGLLFETAREILSIESLEIFESYKTQIFDHLENPKLSEMLNYQYQMRKNHTNLPGSLYRINKWEKNGSNQLDNLVFLIAKEHPGKVLFIDIWAPWCRPCIEDMHASKDIINHDFEGSDVLFFYICGGADPDACSEFVRNRNFAGIHIYPGEENLRTILSDFNISGYPHQIIINREGTVVQNGSRFHLAAPHTSRYLRELL